MPARCRRYPRAAPTSQACLSRQQGLLNPHPSNKEGEAGPDVEAAAPSGGLAPAEGFVGTISLNPHFIPKEPVAPSSLPYRRRVSEREGLTQLVSYGWVT